MILPECFKPLLLELSRTFGPEDFVFPGDRKGRHLSPRTVARLMKRALAIAHDREGCHTALSTAQLRLPHDLNAAAGLASVER